MWSTRTHSTAASSSSEVASDHATLAQGQGPGIPSPALNHGLASSFADKYELLGEELGTGCSGIVQRAVCKETGQHVAVKTYAKQEMSPKDLAMLQSEVELQKALDHPSIVQFVGVYEAQDTTCLVLEELRGGEVLERLVERGRLSEAEVADLAWQALQALTFLHRQGIAHRDVKLENLLYVEQDGREVKLIDFGFAARVEEGLTSKCGSLGYTAPEVLSGRPYDERCDLWSLGSLVYLLLTGRPLLAGSDQEVYRQTLHFRRPDVGMEFWCLSEGAQDFVRALLQARPAQRATAQEALAHPWLASVAVKEALSITPAPAAIAPAVAAATAAPEVVSLGRHGSCCLPRRRPHASRPVG